CYRIIRITVKQLENITEYFSAIASVDLLDYEVVVFRRVTVSPLINIGKYLWNKAVLNVLIPLLVVLSYGFVSPYKRCIIIVRVEHMSIELFDYLIGHAKLRFSISLQTMHNHSPGGLFLSRSDLRGYHCAPGPLCITFLFPENRSRFCYIQRSGTKYVLSNTS